METAPSTYAKQFALPDGLPELLKDLTREILRHQPEDINAFAADFFAERMQSAPPRTNSYASFRGRRRSHDDDAGSVLDTDEPAALLSEMSPTEIEELIHSLFREQDADSNHTLDRHEFKAVFNKLGARLGLRKNDVRRILAEADRDENGQISYAEFIPVAVSIIETIVAKWELQQEKERQARVMHDAESHIYHGMPAEELEEILTNIFREADADGNGTLDLDEFERCLRDIRIGMTRKEFNVVMFETYADEEGKIDYEAFKPLCTKLLVELTAQEWMAPSQDAKDLEEYIVACCRKQDPEASGLLHTEVLQRVLSKADLGLTLVQICSIRSEAEEDAHGLVDYMRFAPRCAFMVHACQHYRQKMSEKKERMQNLHSAEGWGMVFGRDRDTLEGELEAALQSADVDGAACLAREDIKKAVREVLGDDLDRTSMNALLALAPQTETGQFKYRPLVEQAFRTLKGVLELAIIYEDDDSDAG